MKELRTSLYDLNQNFSLKAWTLKTDLTGMQEIKNSIFWTKNPLKILNQRFEKTEGKLWARKSIFWQFSFKKKGGGVEIREIKNSAQDLWGTFKWPNMHALGVLEGVERMNLKTSLAK